MAVHSISTSTLRGRVLTATQLCDGEYVPPFHQQRVSSSRPAGFYVAPVLAIDLVHGGEVVHASEEDIHLDDLEDIRSGSLQDGRKVLDALVLLERSVCLEKHINIVMSRHRLTVCAWISPGIISPVSASIGTAPETNTKPFALMAWL